MLWTRSAISVATFILHNHPTIQEYYDFVTQNDIDFTYDVDAPGRLDSTALHHACANGNLDLAQALINMGADINSQTDNDLTSLFWAILKGHFNVVKMLIENGAALNDKFGNQLGNDNFTDDNDFDLFNHPDKKQNLNGYIFLAIKQKNQQIADYLIEVSSTKLQDLIVNRLKYDLTFYKKCQLAKKESYISQDCIDAIEGINTNDKSEKLKHQRLELQRFKRNITTAVETNNLKDLQTLLNDTHTYIDLNRLSIHLRRFLWITVEEHGNLDMLKLLIKHGLAITAHNIDGVPVIEIARNNGHHEIADYLRDLQISRYQQLQRDADIQTKKMKSTLFMKGILFDKNSNLFQGLTKHLNEKKSAEITRTISRNI